MVSSRLTAARQPGPGSGLSDPDGCPRYARIYLKKKDNQDLKERMVPAMKKISLNGTWTMRCTEESGWHEAQVPGSVYTDLLRNGLIEDPFWRENELKTFPLMEKDYEYRRTFIVEADLLSADAALLRCEGLDTLCHVFINGWKAGDADNMHRTWEWDVLPLLKEGENEIRVDFDSPLRYIAAENEKRPCWQSTDGTPGFPHLRKVHFQFGWDWGPRLPDAGIWRDIGLQFVSGGRLPNVLVLQEHADGKVRLAVTPEPELKGDVRSLETRIQVISPRGEVFEADPAGVVLIDHPQLWWPAGYGDQPLYTVSVSLWVNGREEDRWERRIGLRTMTVSREKREDGEEFCHVVNGVKVFAMGGDYIPEDNLFGRLSPERTRRLLEDARLANFNAVRIWGGGYYPADDFYDVCDELGLMVWQDFMFACAYYDLTDDFERSITAEAVDNIRRLRHHASLALLCDNNEMEEFHYFPIVAEFRDGKKDRTLARPSHHADYIKMFEYILPKLVREYAPQTFYWPSSPSSGGALDDPQDPSRGDVHYWDVWHGEKPFTDYRTHRFRYVSEFGFQSFPSLPTVESFTLPGDRNIFSRIMERHQRNKSANGKILSYVSQTYRYPKDFDHLLYCSQLLQADAIRCGVEHWRRDRTYCSGTIIWQLNDCWPVASWSSIDYFGRWKALHYAAKRFFAPVLLSCEERGEIDQNPHINEFHPAPIECAAHLCLSNETMAPVSGEVSWALRLPDGTIVREGKEQVEAPARSSVWLTDLVFPEAAVTGHYVSFAFSQAGETVSEGCAIFCAPKHFDFIDPVLSVRAEGDELVVSASAFAKAVEIRSEDPDLLLSDNYFDMNPGERRVHILRGKDNFSCYIHDDTS